MPKKATKKKVQTKRKLSPKKKSAPKKTAKKIIQKITKPVSEKQFQIPSAQHEVEEILAHVAKSQSEEIKIEGAKFDIGVAHNARAMPVRDIPPEYGKNSVTLLTVDPRFAFTYWEVGHDTIIEGGKRLGPTAKLTLRFYDTSGSTDIDASPFWDVEVFDRLGNWYLRLEGPEQRLCLDIGMKNQAGDFFRIARSSVMRLPPQTLARPGPIKWMVATPSGDKLISDAEEYTNADLALLKKILGPFFFDLLMRGRFASLAGSSVEAVFYDVSSLRFGESPTGPSPLGE